MKPTVEGNSSIGRKKTTLFTLSKSDIFCEYSSWARKCINLIFEAWFNSVMMLAFGNNLCIKIHDYFQNV